MKSALAVTSLFVFLSVGIVVTQPATADAEQLTAAQTIFNPEAETLSKKCSFNSDCSHGKCSKNRCGGCSFNSDCKGWGKCSKGWCGGCSFNSDCKGFGKCSSGKCTKAPY